MIIDNSISRICMLSFGYSHCSHIAYRVGSCSRVSSQADVKLSFEYCVMSEGWEVDEVWDVGLSGKTVYS